MELETVLQWIDAHPGSVHGDAQEFVSRCERTVRRHAREDAWVAAKRHIARRRQEWESNPGSHASEVYVARQLCGQLAHDLRRHRPAPRAGDEDHLAGAPLKAAVEREGWVFLSGWILDLAREQANRDWLEIVHYTEHRAADLIREQALSDDCSLENSKCYGEIAEQIAEHLMHDYSVHAFPR